MALQHTLTDLDGPLGNKWFICCFNSNGDFGYVIIKTVTFLLKKRRPLVEYKPRLGALEKLTFSQGCLQFNFVRGDGVASYYIYKIFFRKCRFVS